MNVALRTATPSPMQPWYSDNKMVALVKRTAAKDCNNDEFDEFTAVCRELGLNPLRKQIYAFVFNKNDEAKRNMVIVVGIDGMRTISARSGFYRPDDKAPRWTIDPEVKDEATNPHGIISCDVSIFVGNKLRDANGGERIEWNEVVGTAYWDEFAPILKTADADDYEWVETGETYADSGRPKKRKKLRAGAEARLQLDPKKEGWRKSGRHMIAKCAEAIAHRRANPEPFSRVYSDEEVDRARTIDAEYVDLTPSEMAAKGEADARLDRIGGPALMAALGADGVLERIPHGLFADRVLEVTSKLAPAAIAALIDRNAAAFREFWAFNKTDALQLKKVLEERSAGTPSPSPHKAAPSAAADPEGGAAATPGALSVGPEAFKLKGALITQLRQLSVPSDFLAWARDAQVHMNRLPPAYRTEVETELQRCQEQANKNRKS